MKISLFIYGLFAFLICLTPSSLIAQTDSTNTNPKILLVGLRNPGSDFELARQMIAEWYDFSYEVAAGCIVSDELMDSVRTNNDSTYAYLQRQHGADWKKEFDALVNIEKENIPLLNKLINDHDSIKSMHLNYVIEIAHYSHLKNRETSIYTSTIYIYNYENKEFNKAYVFEIELDKNSIKLITTKEE